MTIKESIFQSKTKRAEKLRALKMPEYLIEKEMNSLPKALEEFGNLTIINKEQKKGRGGIYYWEFLTDEGKIYYFPNARFGAFLTKNQK